MLIGAHVSSQGGVVRVPARAADLGARVAQCFLSSPRAWRFRAQPTDATALAGACAAQGLAGIYAHAPYLVNIASNDQELQERSRTLLGATVLEASRLRLAGVVWHPGSHRGTDPRGAIARWAAHARPIVASLNPPTTLYLENTAGGGGSIGRTPGELAQLVELLGAPEGVGVAIDTQHLFAAGFDLRDAAVRRDLIAELKGRFGHIDVLHVNDSLTDCGSLHDRHANIGEGAIGPAALAAFVSDLAHATTAALLEVPGAGEGPRAQDVRTLAALVSSPR